MKIHSRVTRIAGIAGGRGPTQARRDRGVDRAHARVRARPKLLLVQCALLLVLAVPVRLSAQNDTARATNLLQRATFGARPEEVSSLLRTGAREWLDRQLHPERIDDSALAGRLASFPAASMTVAQLYGEFPPPQIARRLAGVQPGDTSRAQPRKLPGRSPMRMAADVIGAKLQRAVYSERQLQEVMTDFWFNHFNVFFGKNLDRYLISDYERTAIRPHVFGKFEDMLVATAQHPAMLYYLDNWMSAVVDTMSPAYQRMRSAKRKPGINENYARELMELHTLGVDGGYTQQDVINVARAFTGWTIQQPRLREMMQASMTGEPMSLPEDFAGPTFVFRAGMHDRGQKVVLGQRINAGDMLDGMQVLHMLAHSPATAHHIAVKLVERFVSDDPQPALVDRIAKVFLDTDGDLREVTRALFSSREFNDPRYYRAKVKTPFEVVVSALRATHADVGQSRMLLMTLRSLGELPYQQQFPTGYPAASAEWVNSGAMLNRMNFALALASGTVDHVRIDTNSLIANAPITSKTQMSASGNIVAPLLNALVPGAPTNELRETVIADLRALDNATQEQRLARAAGLILGSPEFQRR
jgi:uncharacterized protein (DUF1800 family)